MPSMKLEDPYALLEGARRFHLALKRLPVLGLGILLLERGILRLLEEVRGLRTSPWDHPLARLILLLDLHERKTIAYLEGRLRPGMRVVDIGAHVGYHTKRFARLVGERGIVLAFEPDPGTFRLLQANLHKQRNVYLFNVAVTDKPGLYRLVAPASFREKRGCGGAIIPRFKNRECCTVIPSYTEGEVNEWSLDSSKMS